MFVTYVKVALTYLRHGLDPLAPVGRNAGKAADRFSDSEKEFVIHIRKPGSQIVIIQNGIFRRYRNEKRTY